MHYRAFEIKSFFLILHFQWHCFWKYVIQRFWKYVIQPEGNALFCLAPKPFFNLIFLFRKNTEQNLILSKFSECRPNSYHGNKKLSDISHGLSFIYIQSKVDDYLQQEEINLKTICFCVQQAFLKNQYSPA